MFFSRRIRALRERFTRKESPVSRWKHFRLDGPDNIACPCCGELIQDDLFFSHMDALDRMREDFGFPIKITSGHRCKKHNRAVGGAKQSMHLKFATDVKAGDGDADKLKMIEDAAPQYGFTGIGTYSSWVHLDRREKPARWSG